jgi:glycosyltransferase involved in cell wall biosynthesis
MEVSVLVTTYNHERYIAQALDSVLMQETDFDYEIVILEDCSTDATREIVLAYQKRHPDKIRLRLNDRNQCSNKPTAEAIQTAPSRYIAILDGDDYWTSSKKLEKQVEFLEAHPECVLCFHNALRIYEDESRPSLRYNFASQKQISAFEDIWQYNFIAGCTPMFRKDALGHLPEWFYTLNYGDWPLYILCALHGKIGYIDETLGVYRIHHGGLWSRHDAIQKLEGLIAFYETMNTNLDFRFNEIVEPLISARRKELAVAHALVKTAQKVLPSGTVVLVMARAGEDLPPLKGHQMWAFPELSGKQTQRQFASGPAGSAEAPWIGAGAVYEFRLYGGAAHEELLASVTVTQNSAALCSSLPEREPSKKGAFIEASPNPVPSGTQPGKTKIDWSTGDGSKGVIRVLMKSLRMQYPANDDEAIEQFEMLRAKGGEFLLVPRTLFSSLEGYVGLKEHLDCHYCVVQDDEACLIYDLRKMPSENRSGTPTEITSTSEDVTSP